MSKDKSIIKKKYPKFYDSVVNYIDQNNNKFWTDIKKSIGSSYNDATEYIVFEAVPGETNIIPILDALDHYNLVTEQEGDHYREMMDDLVNNDNYYEIKCQMIKWYYNKFGDQGYLFFIVKEENLNLFKWFFLLNDRDNDEIINKRGPLHFSFEEMKDYIEEEEGVHKINLINLVKEYLEDYNKLNTWLEMSSVVPLSIKKKK